MEWIVQLPVLCFSVVFHEFFHGWTAWRMGDDTAEKAGRLTLNPLAHVDPFGTLFLPMLCFLMGFPMMGWAKPLPVCPSRLRNPRLGAVAVALMGPASNLLLAVCAVLAYKAATLAAFLQAQFQGTLLDFLLYALKINLFLAFFNLLPVHPLDGSKVLGGLLPRAWERAYGRHAPYGAFIILLLISTKAFGPLVLLPSRLVLSAFARLGLIG